MREATKSLATVVASLALWLALAEGVCRLLPVSTGLATQAVDAGNPVIRFTPNRDFVHSTGWRLTNPVHGHVNNYGFVNDQDYDPGDSRPLLAVIGDSYVEASMVPYGETLHGRVAARQDGRRRVYSFGAAGSSLLDYLYYAAYVRAQFHADWLVINVVGNDFDEMLLRYKQAPGFHYLEERPDGSLAPVLREYRPGIGVRIVRASALARYLALNIGPTSPAVAHLVEMLQRAGERLIGPAKAAEPEFVGNTAASTDPQRVALSQRAVRYALDRLPEMSGLPADHVLLLIDSYRVFDDTAVAAARASYFGVMRDYLIAEARRRGFEIQDLQDWFAQRHARDGAVFQFADDGHWNAAGHEEAANAIVASAVYARFTEQPAP